MDLKKLSEDELIKLCDENEIEYFNSKTKKNYARTTLISRINKSSIKPNEIEIKKEDEIINIEYKNEVIWTLSNEEYKNIRLFIPIIISNINIT